MSQPDDLRYVDDRPVGPDCMFTCAPGATALCETEWCRCTCHDEQPDNFSHPQEVNNEAAGRDGHPGSVHRDIHTP